MIFGTSKKDLAIPLTIPLVKWLVKSMEMIVMKWPNRWECSISTLINHCNQFKKSYQNSSQITIALNFVFTNYLESILVVIVHLYKRKLIWVTIFMKLMITFLWKWFEFSSLRYHIISCVRKVVVLRNQIVSYVHTWIISLFPRTWFEICNG